MAVKKADETDVETKPKKCFVMMPISDVDGYPSGHFLEVYEQLISPAVQAAGYECEWAPSTSAAHMIQLDIVTKAATFDLAICDLSTRNGNVLFEYGIRQAFDKPTVLIRDDKTPRLFDVLGFRDVEYDHNLRVGNTLSAREKISKAIRDTVDGSKDGSQIFSLVSLMKLTKAAFSGDVVDKDDARFQLLEAQMKNITTMISNNRFTEYRLPGVEPFRIEFHEYGEFQLYPDRIVLKKKMGPPIRFASARLFFDHSAWQDLTPSRQDLLMAQIKIHCGQFVDL